MSAWEKCPECGIGVFTYESEPVLEEEDGLLVCNTSYVYSCGHSFTVARVPKPIDVIEDSIKKKKGFEGIILANVFFENFAYRIISKYLENNNRNISRNKLDNMTLNDYILFLYGAGIINQVNYTKMIEVKNKRNELVHSKKGSYDMKRFYLFESDEQKVTRLLKLSKDVIKYLEQILEELECA